MERFEIVEDGPGRFVIVDNESDDPAPVFESTERATRELRDLCSSIDEMATRVGGRFKPDANKLGAFGR